MNKHEARKRPGSQEDHGPLRGAAGYVAKAFVDSKLTPIAVVASVLMGAFAVFLLPREEEPQIDVPMVDIHVAMPGSTEDEVAERVTKPMEKFLWEVPGVEYLYSASMPGRSMVTARFYVGENLEESLVKLNQKLQTNFDKIPPGASEPLVVPRTINDVPVLTLTFSGGPGEDTNAYLLRRLVAEVEDRVKRIPDVAETMVIGGPRRQLRVQLDPVRLASRNLTPLAIAPRLAGANRQSFPGELTYDNRAVFVQTGEFLPDAEAVRNLVVGVYEGRPVYLKDVADIMDGPEDPEAYVMTSDGGPERDAVTLTVAKRPGTNAVRVVKQALEKVESLRGHLIPEQIDVTVTRNYGETATEKSNELLLHMASAIIGVALLIVLFLGWRDSLVVLLAIPSTLALTLLVFYLFGYTLNRITLFALIFSIGILVDDAIVVVENVTRHLRLPRNERRPLRAIAIEAVDEVGNPTILATLAVIAAILPMAFVGGLMGPYMRPIPVGASSAMLFSLIIAFTVTPWAAKRFLKRRRGKGNSETVAEKDGLEEAPDDFFTRFYHWFMEPLLAKVRWRWLFLFGIGALLLGALALVPLGLVKVKMLPFDNKSEFQLILNMPEGTSLEETTRVAQDMAEAVRAEPEVQNTQVYAGTAAPFNFNGLVRRYYAREGNNVADVQVNLSPRHHRKAQSHAIAKRIRPLVSGIAQDAGGMVQVAEVPPGPPVLQTLVAEVYGPSEDDRIALAREVKALFEENEGVVDVDWFVEAPQAKPVLVVDKEKAALNGISEASIAEAISMAIGGETIGLLHDAIEAEDVEIVVELPRRLRARPADLLKLRLRSETDPKAPLVPLRELVQVKDRTTDTNIYRKNLKPVVYVTADVAGEAESPAYAILQLMPKIQELDARKFGGSSERIHMHHAFLPFSDQEPAIKWDGEWHITIEVFRDLGIAFAVVLVLIYMLMVGWFKSYLTPLVVMAAIPFSLIGILPAHLGFNAFFTATSMIGFMAGAGIVVRNSIILVDFIELRMRQGMELRKAVVEAGAVRFRPMMLTALALVIGASFILFDPIFQGLALSLMFGEIASLLISRMAVPVLYYMLKKDGAETTPA